MKKDGYLGQATKHISETNFLFGEAWNVNGKIQIACANQCWHGYEGAIGMDDHPFFTDDADGWKVSNTKSDMPLDLYGEYEQ